MRILKIMMIAAAMAAAPMSVSAQTGELNILKDSSVGSIGRDITATPQARAIGQELQKVRCDPTPMKVQCNYLARGFIGVTSFGVALSAPPSKIKVSTNEASEIEEFPMLLLTLMIAADREETDKNRAQQFQQIMLGLAATGTLHQVEGVNVIYNVISTSNTNAAVDIVSR